MNLRIPLSPAGRLAGLGLAGALLAAPLGARAGTLYSLDSFCSLDGGDAVPCRIEAVDTGTATEYRHRIGEREVRYRISEDPYTRVEIWEAAGNRWRNASNASAFFALNAVCLDGTSFCAINPNYLNSVRQDLGRAASGRRVMKVHFGDDGRIDATCYDAGCPDGGGAGKGQ